MHVSQNRTHATVVPSMLRIAASRLPPTLCHHAPVLTRAAGVLWSIAGRRNVRLTTMTRLKSTTSMIDPKRALYPERVRDVVKPTPPDEWISDHGKILGASRTDFLNRELSSLKKVTGAEFAVVTLQDLGPSHDYGALPEAYGAFSKDLFDSWGIGRSYANDGLLLVLFSEGRRVEVVSGQGLSTRTPMLGNYGLGIMQTKAMIPLLRAGNHGGAVEAGTLALVRAVRESAPKGYLGESSNNKHDSGFGGGSSGGGGSSSNWAYIAMGVLSFVGFAYLYAKSRKNLCPECGEETTIVPAEDAGSLLSPGNQMERELGSCSFHVRHCHQCGHKKIDSTRQNWDYKKCRDCGYFTAVETAKLTVEPSHDSNGEGVIEEACKYCGRHRARLVKLSPTVKSNDQSVSRGSGSSSSIGSSSGGGSSSNVGSSSGGSSSSIGTSSGGFGGGSSSGGASAGSSW